MELKNAYPPETVTEVWNLDIICNKKYTRTMTRRKAKELLRAFKRAPRSERRSSAFIRGARMKLEVLHLYNKNVLLKKERYPRTKWMFHLLCRYVALEFESLGPNPDPSNCEAKFVASVLENMLSNYFDVDSKIRSKVFSVYIIVSAYRTYKIPKWYMDTLAGLVLKGTVIQKQLDDLYSGDDDLLYVGNIWSNNFLKYFLESDDFATDDEDSDISDQEESKSAHRKNRRKMEKLTKEDDDDDVILIKDERDTSDCDSMREFNSPVRDGSSKQGSGRSNSSNQESGAVQKSPSGNKHKSKLCGDVITIDDDDNVSNRVDVNSECVDSDVEVVYCDLRTGRAKNRTRRKPRTKFSSSVNSPDVKRSPKPICVDDDEDEIATATNKMMQKFDVVIKSSTNGKNPGKMAMELPGSRIRSESTKDSNLDFLRELESIETERDHHSAIIVTQESFSIDDNDDFLKELQELASIGPPSGAKNSEGTLGSASSIGVRFVETNSTSSVGMDRQTAPISKRLLGLEESLTISSQLEEVSSTQNIPMGENSISTEGQPVDLQIGQSNIAHDGEKIVSSEVEKMKGAVNTITDDSVSAIAILSKTCKVDLPPTVKDDIKRTQHADFKESPITAKSKMDGDKLRVHPIESIHSETETSAKTQWKGEYEANAEDTRSNQSILKTVRVDESQKINDAKFGKKKLEIEDGKVSASKRTPEKTTKEDHVQSQSEESRATHESLAPEEAVSALETLKTTIVQAPSKSPESLEKLDTEASKSIFKNVRYLPTESSTIIKGCLNNSTNNLPGLTNSLAHIESQPAGKIVTSPEGWRKASQKHLKVSDDQDCNLLEEGYTLKVTTAQTIQALKSQEVKSPEDLCRRREDIENHTSKNDENSEKDLINSEESTIFGSESNQTSERIINAQTEDSDQSMECEDDELKGINNQKILVLSKIENRGSEDLYLTQNDQKDDLEPPLFEESQSEYVDSINAEIENIESKVGEECKDRESKPVDLESHPLEETRAESVDSINTETESNESKPLEIVTKNCKDREIKSRALKESHAEYVNKVENINSKPKEIITEESKDRGDVINQECGAAEVKSTSKINYTCRTTQSQLKIGVEDHIDDGETPKSEDENSLVLDGTKCNAEVMENSKAVDDCLKLRDPLPFIVSMDETLKNINNLPLFASKSLSINSGIIQTDEFKISASIINDLPCTPSSLNDKQLRESKKMHKMNLKVPQSKKNISVADATPAVLPEETGPVTTTIHGDHVEETKIVENFEKGRLEEDIVSPHCIETTPLVEHVPAAQHEDILEETQTSLVADTFEAASTLEYNFEEEEIVQMSTKEDQNMAATSPPEEEIVQMSTKEDQNMVTTSLPAESDGLVAGIVEETRLVSSTHLEETKIMENYEQRRLEEDIISPHFIETTPLVEHVPTAQHEDTLEEKRTSLVGDTSEAASTLEHKFEEEEIVQMPPKEDQNMVATSLPADSDRLDVTVQDTTKLIECKDVIQEVALVTSEEVLVEDDTTKCTESADTMHVEIEDVNEKSKTKKQTPTSESSLQVEAALSEEYDGEKPENNFEDEGASKPPLRSENENEMREERCVNQLEDLVTTEDEESLKLKGNANFHEEHPKLEINEDKRISKNETETPDVAKCVGNDVKITNEIISGAETPENFNAVEDGLNTSSIIVSTEENNEDVDESITPEESGINQTNKVSINYPPGIPSSSHDEELLESNTKIVDNGLHITTLVKNKLSMNLGAEAIPPALHEEIDLVEKELPMNSEAIQSEQKILVSDAVPTVLHEEIIEETSSVPTTACEDQSEEAISALTIPREDQFEETSSVPTIPCEDQFEETSSPLTITREDQFEETGSVPTIPHEETSSVPNISHEVQFSSVPTILHEDQFEETSSALTIAREDQFEETNSVPTIPHEDQFSSVPTILHEDQFEETGSVLTIPHEETSSVPTIFREDQFEETSTVPTIVHEDQFEETVSVPTIPLEGTSSVPTIFRKDQFEQTGSVPTILHEDQFEETGSVPTIPHEGTSLVPTIFREDQFEETSTVPTVLHEDEFEETVSVPTIPLEGTSSIPTIFREDQFEETDSVPTILHEDQFSSVPIILHEGTSSVPTIFREDQFEETSTVPTIVHEDQFEETISVPTIPHEGTSSVPTIFREDHFEETGSVPTILHEDQFEETGSVPTIPHEGTSSVPTIFREDQFEETSTVPTVLHEDQFEETSTVPTIFHEDQFEEASTVPTIPSEETSAVSTIPHEDLFSSVPTIPHKDIGSVPTIPHKDIGSVPTIPHEEPSSVPIIPHEDQFSSVPTIAHEETSSVPTILHEDQFEETCTVPTTPHEETSSVATIPHEDQFEETGSVPTIPHEETSSVPIIPHEDQFSSVPTIAHEDQFEETGSVPTILHEETSSVPTIPHEDQFEEIGSIPTIPYEETSSIPTIPHEETSTAPTILHEDQFSSLPTIPHKDQSEETGSVPTMSHGETCTVPTIPYEETSTVPTIHEDQFEEIGSIPTIPYEETSSVPTIPHEETSSVPNIPHEDHFEETSSAPTIHHAHHYEETEFLEKSEPTKLEADIISPRHEIPSCAGTFVHNNDGLVEVVTIPQHEDIVEEAIIVETSLDQDTFGKEENIIETSLNQDAFGEEAMTTTLHKEENEEAFIAETSQNQDAFREEATFLHKKENIVQISQPDEDVNIGTNLLPVESDMLVTEDVTITVQDTNEIIDYKETIPEVALDDKAIKPVDNEINTAAYDASGSKENIAKKAPIDDVFFTYGIKNENCDLGENGSRLSCDAQESARKLLECNMLVLYEAVEKKIIQESRSRFKLSSMKQEEAEAEPKNGNKKRKKNTVKANVGRKPMTRSCSKSTKGGKKDIENLKPLQSLESELKKSAPTAKNTRGRKTKNIEMDVVAQNKQLWKAKAGKLEETKTAKRKKLPGKLKEKNAVGKKKDFINKNLKVSNSNDDSSDSFEGKLIIPDEPMPMDCSLLPKRKSSEVHKKEVIPTKMMCEMAIQPEPVPSLAEAVSQSSVCQDVSKLLDAGKKQTNYHMDYILGNVKAAHDKVHIRTKAQMKAFPEGNAPEKIDIDSLPYSVNSLLKVKELSAKNLREISEKNVEPSSFNLKGKSANMDIPEDRLMSPKKRWELLNKTEMDAQKHEAVECQITPKKRRNIFIEADIKNLTVEQNTVRDEVGKSNCKMYKAENVENSDKKTIELEDTNNVEEMQRRTDTICDENNSLSITSKQKKNCKIKKFEIPVNPMELEEGRKVNFAPESEKVEKSANLLDQENCDKSAQDKCINCEVRADEGSSKNLTDPANTIATFKTEDLSDAGIKSALPLTKTIATGRSKSNRSASRLKTAECEESSNEKCGKTSEKFITETIENRKKCKKIDKDVKKPKISKSTEKLSASKSSDVPGTDKRSFRKSRSSKSKHPKCDTGDQTPIAEDGDSKPPKSVPLDPTREVQKTKNIEIESSGRSLRSSKSKRNHNASSEVEKLPSTEDDIEKKSINEPKLAKKSSPPEFDEINRKASKKSSSPRVAASKKCNESSRSSRLRENKTEDTEEAPKIKSNLDKKRSGKVSISLQPQVILEDFNLTQMKDNSEFRKSLKIKSARSSKSTDDKVPEIVKDEKRKSRSSRSSKAKDVILEKSCSSKSDKNKSSHSKDINRSKTSREQSKDAEKKIKSKSGKEISDGPMIKDLDKGKAVTADNFESTKDAEKKIKSKSGKEISDGAIMKDLDKEKIVTADNFESAGKKIKLKSTEEISDGLKIKDLDKEKTITADNLESTKDTEKKIKSKSALKIKDLDKEKAVSTENFELTEKKMKSKSIKEISGGLKMKNQDKEKTVTADNFESTEKKNKSKSAKEISDGLKVKDLDKDKTVKTADNFESIKDTEKKIKSKSTKEIFDGSKIKDLDKEKADSAENFELTEKKIKSKSTREISDGLKIKDLDKEKTVTADNLESTKDTEKKIKSKSALKIKDLDKEKAVSTENFELTEKKIKSKSTKEISDGPKVKDLDKKKTVTTENFESPEDTEKEIKSKSVKEISDGPKITADNFEQPPKASNEIANSKCKQDKKQNQSARNKITIETLPLNREETVPSGLDEENKRKRTNEDGDKSACPKSIPDKKVASVKEDVQKDMKANEVKSSKMVNIESSLYEKKSEGKFVASVKEVVQRNEEKDIKANEAKSSKVVNVESSLHEKKSEGKFAEEAQPCKVNGTEDNEQTSTKPEGKNVAKLKTAEVVQSRKRKRGEDNEDRRLKKTIKLADESGRENVEESSKKIVKPVMNVDDDNNATVNAEDNRSESKEAKLKRRIEGDIQKSSRKGCQRKKSISSENCTPYKTDADGNSSRTPKENKSVECCEENSECLLGDAGKIQELKFTSENTQNVKFTASVADDAESASTNITEIASTESRETAINEAAATHNNTEKAIKLQENSLSNTNASLEAEREEIDHSANDLIPTVQENSLPNKNASLKTERKEIDLIPTVEGSKNKITSVNKTGKLLININTKENKAGKFFIKTNTKSSEKESAVEVMETQEIKQTDLYTSKSKKCETKKLNNAVSKIVEPGNNFENNSATSITEDAHADIQKDTPVGIKCNSNTEINKYTSDASINREITDEIISAVPAICTNSLEVMPDVGKSSVPKIEDLNYTCDVLPAAIEDPRIPNLEKIPVEDLQGSNRINVATNRKSIEEVRADEILAEDDMNKSELEPKRKEAKRDDAEEILEDDVNKSELELKRKLTKREDAEEILGELDVNKSGLELKRKSAKREDAEEILEDDVNKSELELKRKLTKREDAEEILEYDINKSKLKLKIKPAKREDAEEILGEHDVNKSELELKRKPAKIEDAEEILEDHINKIELELKRKLTKKEDAEGILKDDINKRELELKRRKLAKRDDAEEILGEHDINKSELEPKSKPAKREDARKRSKSSKATTNSHDSDGDCKVVKLGKREQKVEKYEYRPVDDGQPKPEAETVKKQKVEKYEYKPVDDAQTETVKMQTGDLKKSESAEPKQPNVIVEPIPQFYNEVYRLDDPINIIPLVATPEKIEPVQLVDFLEDPVLIDDELSTSGSPNVSKPDTPPLDFDETPLSEKVKKKGSFSTKASSGTQTAVRDPCLSEQVYIALKPIVSGPLDNSPGDSDADHPFSEQDNPLGFFIENNLIQDECLIDPDTTENMFIPNTCKQEVIEHEEKAVHYFTREQQPTPQLSDDFINDNDKQIREEFSEELMSVEAMNKIMDKSLQAAESLQSQTIPKSVNKERHPFVCTTLGFANMDGLHSSDATWSQESIMRTKEPFIPDTIKEMFLNNNTVPELNRTETAPAKMQKPPTKEKTAKKIIGKVNLVNIRKLKPENKDERNVYVRASSLSRVCTETAQKRGTQRSPIKDSQNMILDKVPVQPNAKWAHTDVPRSRGKVETDVNAFKQNGRKRVLPQTEIIEETPRKRIKSNIIDPEEVSNNFEQEIRKKPMDHRHFIATPEQDTRYTRSPSLSRRHTPNNSKSALHPMDSDKYKYYPPESTNSRGPANNSATPRRSKQSDNRYRQYEQDHTMNTRSQYNNSRFLNHAEPSVQIDNRHRHYSENPNNRVNSSNYYNSTSNRHLYAGSSVGRPHDRNRRDSYLTAHHSSRKEVSYPLSNFRVGNPRLQYQQQSWEDNNAT